MVFINILQVFNSFGRGGAEVLTMDVIKNYPNNKGEMYLWISKGGALEEDCKAIGIKINKVKMDKAKICYVFKLRYFIKIKKIHVVHVHNPLDVIYARLAVIGLSTKVVYSVHGHFHSKSQVQWALRKLILQMADKLIFVSDDLACTYKSKFKIENYNCLHNGIDNKKLLRLNSTLKEELNISENIILGGMVGNFHSNARDQLFICKALKNIIKHNHYFRFVFVGSKSESHPEYFNSCFNFCAENGLLSHVFFLGSRSDIANILAGLDIFLYASNYETFGIALVEALISGTPVIVNDLQIFKEITNNGQCACLYKTKDIDNLVAKTNWFLQNPYARETLGMEGKKWATEKYKVEKHIDQLHQIYQDLLYA